MMLTPMYLPMGLGDLCGRFNNDGENKEGTSTIGDADGIDKAMSSNNADDNDIFND